jgi:hypothetical protein
MTLFCCSRHQSTESVRNFLIDKLKAAEMEIRNLMTSSSALKKQSVSDQEVRRRVGTRAIWCGRCSAVGYLARRRRGHSGHVFCVIPHGVRQQRSFPMAEQFRPVSFWYSSKRALLTLIPVPHIDHRVPGPAGGRTGRTEGGDRHALSAATGLAGPAMRLTLPQGKLS